MPDGIPARDCLGYAYGLNELMKYLFLLFFVSKNLIE